MDKENIVYQLRYHNYTYDNSQQWEAGTSRLGQEYDNKKDAYDQLRINNIWNYFGKPIFQHISTLGNSDEKSQKLLEYLTNELDLDEKAINTIKNNINFDLSSVGLSFEQAEQIHKILQINFCFVKKVDKNNMSFYGFSEHLDNDVDGVSSWLYNIKFESYDSAIDHVIHKIIDFYIKWTEWFNPDLHENKPIWCVSGPAQKLAENPKRFLDFMEQSKYFSFANNRIELKKIPKVVKRTSTLTFRSGEKHEMTIYDYEEDIKNECRELIKIMREGRLFVMERI